MLIRNEEFALLVGGTAWLPKSAGLVGTLVRYADNRSPSLLSLRVVSNVHDEVATLISERTLDTLLRNRGPGEMTL